MRTDTTTKILMMFVGSGLWAVVVTGLHLPRTATAATAGPDTSESSFFEKATYNVVRTRRLEVVDESGAVAAEVWADEKGATLRMGSFGSRGLVLLSANKSAAAASVGDPSSGGSVSLACQEKGPSVIVSDQNGKLRAVLGVNHLTDPTKENFITTAPSALALFDKDGKVVFKAP